MYVSLELARSTALWAAMVADAGGDVVAITAAMLHPTGLAAFAGLTAHCVVRSVDPPEPPLPARTTVVLERGPFSLDDERALLREHAVQVVVTKADGTEDVVVDNGTVVGDANRTFRMVTSVYLSTGGDTYPFPAFSGLNVVQLSKLPAGGTASITTEGHEQNVFATYVQATYPMTGPGYSVADTVRSGDKRILYLAP